PGCPTGPSLDCPQNSWATGTNPTVDSVRERLDAISPQTLTAYNDAVSGARAVNLVGQAETAAAQNPDFVLIEIGANDACASTPTPTATFREQVREAFEVLVSANKQVYIQLMSIPDINNLRTIFTEPPDPNAIGRWAAFSVCQGLLANPLSTEPADEARREAFRAQVIAYNAALAEVCAEFKRCIWDDEAVFDSSFTPEDVATVANTPTADYFHPSVAGQAKLAEAAWSVTFNDWRHRKGAMTHAG
ncbi:MAG TPA: SGNH/GDSL hydrolase family protein, partial [Solirubrobacterales bacterium]|nr:SGNH/GDSL hydrolase family protein [Solirubrobacterales bacterium]